MPVVDWTRTDLDYPVPTGATALRFDYDRFAAFDLHVLRRKGAEVDYDEPTRARAREVADGLSQSEAELLTKNISAGLPVVKLPVIFVFRKSMNGILSSTMR